MGDLMDAKRVRRTNLVSALKDLAQRGRRLRSMVLGKAIMRNLEGTFGKHLSRGLRQARYDVLLGLKMPGVLVEMGFLDHPKEGLTVRRIEQIAAARRERRQAPERAARDPYVVDLEDRLRRALGTTVTLHARAVGGRIEVAYHDAAELDRLLELFGAA